jgi:hypothetical protein
MTRHAFSLSLLTVLATLFLCAGTGAAESAEFRSLFNGKDLAGWDGNPDFWSVQDGVIVGQSTPEKPAKTNTFLLWRGGELRDFELRVSFKIENGNSGVQYRSKDLGNWSMAGYQCDIRSPNFDSKDPKNCTGKIYSEREGRGQMALGGEKSVCGKDGLKSVIGKANDLEKITTALGLGDWKQLVIIAKGNHLTQVINGETICELTDEDETKRALSGHLGLQIHAGRPMKVSFKDISLRELK